MTLKNNNNNNETHVRKYYRIPNYTCLKVLNGNFIAEHNFRSYLLFVKSTVNRIDS